MQLVAVVVAALAALGALRYARDTVRESGELLDEVRAQRREDSYARLAELAGDYGAQLRQLAYDHAAKARLPATRAQFRAHVTAASESLPACEALLAVETTADPKVRIEATEAALAEIGKRLGPSDPGTPSGR